MEVRSMPNYDKYDDLLFQLKDDLLHPCNIIDGQPVNTAKMTKIINPLDGSEMFEQPDTQVGEIQPFLNSLAKCPKSGLHNPGNFIDNKGVSRYKILGEVFRKVGDALKEPKVANHFAHLIKGQMPKSDTQCMGEVTVTADGYADFSIDSVRFLSNGTTSPGDRLGQQPTERRMPFGPVVIIAPFNFPLEIPALQILGALAMGNKPLIKGATKTSIVLDQFVSLLHWCGLPMEDLDLIHCSGSVMNELLKQGKDIIQLIQFTGSSDVAEEIGEMYPGRVRKEDAGFNPKIFGPDYNPKYLDYAAYQWDQDTGAAAGQKCSDQRISFVHRNWWNAGIVEKVRILASQRNLKDLTVGPVLSLTTDMMLDHVNKLAKIPGAKILYGGKPLTGHTIPKCYGAIEPTAVFVPLKQILLPQYWNTVTTEIFGPVQVVTLYEDDELPLVLEACERMKNHLTGAVVSNDPHFYIPVVSRLPNGVVYVGYLARTTGAPQNHFFGPGGEPCGAGIGDRQSIIDTWSWRGAVIYDFGPIDYSAKLVQS
jgi:1-pyrroline-5-carboxylate dehydrogenase